jgi:phospholipid/cholesterol/gamma-HCH transport system substrate-binding protein
MKRIAAITALLVATSAVALAGLGAGEEGGVYKVRAIFDNASFVIPGEDVKIAGVRVGAIDAVDVTDDFKAAVTLSIEEPAYQDFRRDAQCIIRPQSLIGEKFVECEPTQKRAAGSEPPPPLERIEDGEGEGEYLLPVENTKRSVDLDLLNTVYRRPYAERFTIILNELGVGLAGRGDDLNDVIERAAPALTELDEVLEILARQNRTLRALAADSDRALAPLARDRESVSGFIENASEVAQATAERREALQASIERLPRFLRELRPTMARLEGLTEEATPVLTDLHSVAPEVNAFIQDLGPFSQAAIPALDELGDAARVGGPALREALPITRDLRDAAKPLRPVADLLGKILTSVDKQRGFQRILDYIYFQVAAVNGFDSFGHYLRAALLVNTCSSYTTVPVPGCLANFSRSRASASASAADMPRDPYLERVRRILAGESVEQVLGERRATKNRRELERMSRAVREQRESTDPIQPAPAGGAPTATEPGGAAPAPPAGGGDEEVDTLLDYLFGGPE